MNIQTILIEGLTRVLGKAPDKIALHEPELGLPEINKLKECIDSGFVSSIGRYVDEFESRLAEFTNSKYAIAVVNGTAALHVALLLAGVKENDEVIIPSLSFVATANAVSYCGAIPHFVDSCRNTLGLDPKALEAHFKTLTFNGRKLVNPMTGRRISAIVPMHTFGHPVEMASLIELAEKYNLPIIEDAAESLGSYYNGQHTGSLGQLGILSFNGNKIITTGGGGAILTNDPHLARLAKHITTTGKVAHHWEFHHDQVAFNYRMPNINAALGCAQMEKLPNLLKAKRILANRYKEFYSAHSGLLEFIVEPAHCQSNYWLNTILIKQSDKKIRDQLLNATNTLGYQCRPAWQLLHTLPMYTSCPRAKLPVAEVLQNSLINIPSSPRLINEQSIA